jgi:hypothetical protein
MREFLTQGTLLDNRNVLAATPTGTYRGLKRIQFTGGMPGYVAAITQFPDQRFTVLCLCNHSGMTPWDTNARIADLYLADSLGPKPLDPDSDRDQRALDRETVVEDRELREFTGAFRLRGEGRIWKIVWEEGKLQLMDHLNEGHPLILLGRNRFRPVGGFFHESARLVFSRSSPESAYSLTSKWVGGTLEFDRVQLVDPSPDQLSEYAGEYESGELAARYRVKVSAGKLFLRVNNLGWEPLDPTVRDEFVPGRRQNHDNRILRFTRNENQQIIGLTAGLWRVKAVTFQRTTP